MSLHSRIDKEIEKFYSIEAGNLDIYGLEAFSIRTQNVLIRGGITNLEKLNSSQIGIIEKFSGAGKKTIEEIESYFRGGAVFKGVHAIMLKNLAELKNHLDYLYSLGERIDKMKTRFHRAVDFHGESCGHVTMFGKTQN